MRVARLHLLCAWRSSALRLPGCCRSILKTGGVPRNSRMASFQAHRERLEQYTGGSVNLMKDSNTGIATILMNNPDRKNAFTGKMMVDLDDAVTSLEGWTEGRGVVLTGAGDSFCSGGDLATVKHICDPVSGNLMSEFMQNLTLRLLSLPLISVAAIQGPALGGGAELTVACDFRVMKDSAKIGFVQSRLGVAPGWGGATKLVKVLGRTKALHLLCSGQVLNAEEAVDIGLADRIYPANCDIQGEAKQWLIQTCSPNRNALHVAKTMVVTASNLDVESSLAIERQLFCKLWGSPDHKQFLSQNIKHK